MIGKKNILILFHSCGSRAELTDYEHAICYGCGTVHSREGSEITQIILTEVDIQNITKATWGSIWKGNS